MSIYSFHHSRLGDIIIHTRLNTSRVKVGWRKGQCVATIPAGLPVEELTAVLDRLADRVLAKKPEGLSFFEGRIIEVDSLKVTLERQSLKPSSIIFKAVPGGIDMLVGSNIPWSNTELITRGLRRIADCVAPGILLPRLDQLAALHNLRPKRTKISHGNNILGTCSNSGEIALSSRCVWLSPELRDYIICHELSHLVHHNHSPRFHELCDQLTGGREKELIKLLKDYKWPF